MKRTMAVILAGGEGERLSILSACAPSPPFRSAASTGSSTSRSSNCVNSDIDDVVVLTQYNPRSLNDHIGLGRPWDLDRNRGGVKMLQPYIARGRVAEWYRGTADAVLQNINVIEHDSSADTVLVLAGDHIYKMDYQPFLAAHRRQAGRRDDRRPPRPARPRRPGWASSPSTTTTASSTGRRSRSSRRATSPRWASTSSRSGRSGAGSARTGSTSGAHVIPAMLDGGARVFGYRFDGYWQDVGTIQSLLGGEHGAPRGQRRARPVRQGVADPHPLRGARAGQDRPDGAGPSEPHLARLRDQRHGRELASCRRASGSTSARSCATRS